MANLVKKVCLDGDFICLHSIHPQGISAFRAKGNTRNIDLYARFSYNLKAVFGVPTSIYKNLPILQQTVAATGIVIYDGDVNNVNRIDGGTIPNNVTRIWESTEGYSDPTEEQIVEEIAAAGNGYIEMNIRPSYAVCGIFINFHHYGIIEQIGTFSAFYENTKHHYLPYYGLHNMGIIKLKEDDLATNNVNGLMGGQVMTVATIYDKKFVYKKWAIKVLFYKAKKWLTTKLARLK